MYESHRCPAVAARIRGFSSRTRLTAHFYPMTRASYLTQTRPCVGGLLHHLHGHWPIQNVQLLIALAPHLYLENCSCFHECDLVLYINTLITIIDKARRYLIRHLKILLLIITLYIIVSKTNTSSIRQC